MKAVITLSPRDCDAVLFELDGKTAPDPFLEAARRVGTEPSRGVVVEDAIEVAVTSADQLPWRLPHE